ncbi:MAG: cupin domain-containing protein [Aquisalimonadaceae bacterium]
MAKIIRADHYRWDVPLKEYKTDGTGFREITRQTLLGESEGEERLNFLTRYFEVQPGGYSSLEEHEHPHAVVIIRGQGEVILHDRVEPVNLHDCVYISPHTWHQFHAVGDEPLGFLCIVDRERDRPRLPEDEDVERLGQNTEVKRRLRV